MCLATCNCLHVCLAHTLFLHTDLHSTAFSSNKALRNLEYHIMNENYERNVVLYLYTVSDWQQRVAALSFFRLWILIKTWQKFTSKGWGAEECNSTIWNKKNTFVIPHFEGLRKAKRMVDLKIVMSIISKMAAETFWCFTKL